MERCFKCNKPLTGEFFKTAYGEELCEDCMYDYMTTDRGKVEYIIGLANGDFSMSDFDADFLGWISVCWTRYRDELNMTLSEIRAIEEKAMDLGIL